MLNLNVFFLSISAIQSTNVVFQRHLLKYLSRLNLRKKTETMNKLMKRRMIKMTEVATTTPMAARMMVKIKARMTQPLMTKSIIN